MKHVASKTFWKHHDALPYEAQRLAETKFQLLLQNPRHPSLELLPLRSGIWRARVGDHYRVLARKRGDVFQWFWIGSHEAYNNLIKRF